MKAFMDRNYLLTTRTAKKLYHRCAATLPIFDFHCHLDAKEIYEDKVFRSITELWLGGDHYKWRLMREAGVPEEKITGGASDPEKFRAFAGVCERAIGNPIYAFSHLEMQRYFGIYEPLTAENADRLYAAMNEKIGTLSARTLIRNSGVDTICTTDDPTSDLRYHIALANDKSFDTRVLPTFRPDAALKLQAPAFPAWIEKLSALYGKPVETYESLKDALAARVDFFDSVGCVVSDHSLEPVPVFSADVDPDAVFKKAKAGQTVTEREADAYRADLLVFLSSLYEKHGWAQQYHIGAQRNNSAARFEKLGPDTGFDAIGDREIAAPLAALLSTEEEKGHLPKTVLYCLNPENNEVIAALMNCFQGEIPGKIQYGAAWWFNDQKDGISRQLETLMQFGLLSEFVGMLTDSRSFLSYARHEYFRRILCDKIGKIVENGEYPNDEKRLFALIRAVCHENAARYFQKA